MIDRSLPKGIIWNDFEKSSGDRCYMDKFDDGKTRQEFAAECDINTIMKRYEDGGAVSHVNRATPQFIDFTALPDLQGKLDIFRMASEAFYSLPAAVRKEYDNDAVKFVEAAQDPANLGKFREWGLAPPAAAPPAPLAVRIVPEPSEGTGKT